MSRNKKEKGGKDSFPRLLRCAFNCARAGIEDKAWDYWDTAISLGYDGPAKMKRQPQIETNRWRRENGLVEHPVDPKPTECRSD